MPTIPVMIIDGKKIAGEIIEKLKLQPRPDKILAAILVGENLISLNFLKQKEKIAEELGIDFRIYRFPEIIKNDELRKEIGKIALLKKVGGVIIQLPLPEHLNKYYILNVIPREKDIDVLGERALGAFYNERNPVLPPAIETIMEIFRIIKIKPSAIAVIGTGFLIGKPIATWLINKTQKLTIFGKGSDLSELKKYDLIISGTGKAGIIKPEMLKKNAGIIDFGYFFDKNGKITGDFDSISLTANGRSLTFYTPTPGGTGPILVSKIFENFYKLC